MTCSVCNTNQAIHSPIYGYLPCNECQQRQANGVRPNPVELVPDYIKEDRVRFKKDIYQPFRGGELSKEYLEAHGTKGIKVSKEEVKRAKRVWPETSYYK